MKRTPLHDLHERLGATLVDFGGWRMPVQYGPILDEVRRVRARAGLFDLSHMGRISLTGGGAEALVERLATCFVARIPVGAIRYGLFCREDGYPIDDLLVYRTAEGIDLVVNAANTDEDLAWIHRHAEGRDVQVTDRTPELAMIAVQGPASTAIVQRVADGIDVAGLGYYRFAEGGLAGIDGVRVSRTGYTGEVGYEIYFPAPEAQRVWETVQTAGEADGLAPIGLGARDTLRLEAGMALYGHEIDGEHEPLEAGLSFAVSFHDDKGDWIGREALLRAREAPRRRLVGITTEGRRVPRQGYVLVRDDRPVGEVRSGAVSPTVGKNIGTAYLPPALAEPGTVVAMDLRGKRQPCEVVELPFYSRTR